MDDIDASDSTGTNGNAIETTVVVDVGVVGAVVVFIVIVDVVDVLEEQPLVPSRSSLFPTVPLPCLVCEQFKPTINLSIAFRSPFEAKPYSLSDAYREYEEAKTN